jgi:hypothetical protein
VNGIWKEGNSKRPKDMEKIHFSVPRPTIENLIRVLVYDFEVPPKIPAQVFEPVLQACEKEFLQVARLFPKEPQPLPPLEK